MAISVSFPFFWAAQPEAWGPSSLLSAGFLYCILSPTGLVSKTQSGVPRAPSAGCWLSLPHLLSNWLNFLCTQLYNSLTSTQYLSITGYQNVHFRLLWNGMSDRHRAEITVIQFTGHSLPVHQFVTVRWDFNAVPYCQPSSHTPMEYVLPLSLEWHVWPGRRSIYNKYTRLRSKTVVKPANLLQSWTHESVEKISKFNKNNI